MGKPNWKTSLAVVLKWETIEKKLLSERTGKEYTAEVIPSLKVRSTGNVEKLDDGFFRYSIVDSKNGLDYAIKVRGEVQVTFGTPLEFIDVRGGITNSGTDWYNADSVRVLKISNA